MRVLESLQRTPRLESDAAASPATGPGIIFSLPAADGTIGFAMGGDRFGSDHRPVETLNLRQITEQPPERETLGLLARGHLGAAYWPITDRL